MRIPAALFLARFFYFFCLIFFLERLLVNVVFAVDRSVFAISRSTACPSFRSLDQLYDWLCLYE